MLVSARARVSARRTQRIRGWLAALGVGFAWLSTPAHAAELTPELAAQIEYEIELERAELKRAHGEQSATELSAAERRALIRREAETERAVLERHEIDRKEFARYTARLSREERARLDAELARLRERKSGDARATDGGSDIEVEHGHPIEAFEGIDGGR